jgi:thiamine biosynthesis lipoprotein ApbE
MEQMHCRKRVRLIPTIAVVSCIATSARSAEDFVFRHENVMGTSLELRVRATTPRAATAAETRVLAEIDRLSAIFSGYDAESEFSKLQKTPHSPIKVSPELLTILKAADYWMEKSGGAFDPRVESLTRLWTRAAKADRAPSAAELADVLQKIRAPAWRIESTSGLVEYRSDQPVSLNAIAKGYIVGKAAVRAFEGDRSVLGVLLNIGGDLRVAGDMTARIGVASPFHDSETSAPITRVEVRDKAVATSGNYKRGFQIQGKWYSHIFDPRTGRPVDHVTGATVIAADSTTADALATICNVLSIDESLRLVKSIPGVECLLISGDGRIARSDGFNRYEAPLEKTQSAQVNPKAKSEAGSTDGRSPAADAASGAEFELAIKFEIESKNNNGRRYRRPYVAIWIEDKEGRSLRTVILWVSLGGAGPERWIHELKRWHRDDKARRESDDLDLLHTMARATSVPGVYEAIWDGKDDHGKAVPDGEYTLFIEAAREHGTYQIIRKPIILERKPFTAQLKGDIEIKSASIAYRKVSTTREAAK